jgi:hypothetical protein
MSTRRPRFPISESDREIWGKSLSITRSDGHPETGIWEAFSRTGELLFRSDVIVSDRSSHLDHEWSQFLRMIVVLRDRPDGTPRVARFRFAHSHPGIDPEVGIALGAFLFSPADRQKSLVVKAQLEDYGFPDADLEFAILFELPNPFVTRARLRKRTFVLPARLSWRQGDYSPGREVIQYLNSRRERELRSAQRDQ